MKETVTIQREHMGFIFCAMYTIAFKWNYFWVWYYYFSSISFIELFIGCWVDYMWKAKSNIVNSAFIKVRMVFKCLCFSYWLNKNLKMYINIFSFICNSEFGVGVNISYSALLWHLQQWNIFLRSSQIYPALW